MFHDRRDWHARAELFADGEYVDSRRFDPDVLRPWTFNRITQHEDDGVYRSKLTFGKIVLVQRRQVESFADQQILTEDEHDAMPLQKLQELGEIRLTFKPGKVRMRPAEAGRRGGPRRRNDGHTGPKKVYERHKKVSLPMNLAEVH